MDTSKNDGGDDNIGNQEAPQSGRNKIIPRKSKEI